MTNYYETKVSYVKTDTETEKKKKEKATYLVTGVSFGDAEADAVGVFERTADYDCAELTIEAVRKVSFGQIKVLDEKRDPSNWFVVSLAYEDESDKSNNIVDTKLVNAGSQNELNKFIESELNDTINVATFDKRYVKSVKNVRYEHVSTF